MKAKRIAILGSTGSIGINVLKVVDRFPDRFKVVALTAYNSIDLLIEQARKYTPVVVAVSEEAQARVRPHLSPRTRVKNVTQDLEGLVSGKNVDIVVIGMRGSGALLPFLAAVRAGKTVAPANKEALVMAGDFLMAEARRNKATVIPVDSEQSAIFQCLQGNRCKLVRRVHLTASGGALKDVPRSRFDALTVAQVLQHPRWKMGPKITVDSATLMNKGFEVIEALKLFDLHVDQVQVVIHPEAIIHSMVEFIDGSILGQLGVTDMRLPIQYALTYPDRWTSGLPEMNFCALGQLTFQTPDMKKFPALELAFEVARKNGTAPAVLNAADEEAVQAFLDGKIKFPQIYKVVEKVVLRHKIVAHPDVSAILDADGWARANARSVMSRLR